MQDSQEPITVIINNIELKVDSRFADLSGYIKGIASISQTRTFPVSDISIETFELIVKFADINNFKEFHTPKVQSRELREVLSQDNIKFLEELPNKLMIKKLFEASLILDIRCLRDVCASYYACQIYFKNHDIKDYQSVKQKLGIKGEFTPEISKELKAKYQLLLNQ